MSLSAIIPCYNASDTIKAAVDSLLNQTVRPDEIIIIDDGSDQKTKKVIAALDHASLKIITQENKGVCEARNIGIKNANHEFVLTLDADDTMMDKFVEKTLPVLIGNTEIGAVSSWYLMKSRGKMLMHGEPKGGKLEDFLFENAAMGMALFRKGALLEVGGYDLNMRLGFEDWELWIALLKKGWQIKIVEEYLYTYNYLPKSRNKTALKREVELKRYLFKKYREDYLKNYDKTIAHLLFQLERSQNQAFKLKGSNEYKIGLSLLKPFRWLKRKL